MSYIFGSHTIPDGGIDMAARRAANAGFAAVQIFTLPPTYYNDKSRISAKRVAGFKAALDETGIRPEHVMVHAAYVLSAANPDAKKWERSKNGLAKELERSAALGAGAICFHPGSTAGEDEGAAGRVGRAISEAIQTAPGEVRLLVENTAGAGNTFGRTAQEVADILAAVPDALRSRTGYGLDTCHLFASGYDLAESEARLTAILEEWEDTVGEPPSFFHLNDSEGGLGTNRDRHMLIGEGEIGAEPFRWLISDRRARGIPLILETPQKNTGIDPEDPAGDPYDVQMRELLESFIPG